MSRNAAFVLSAMLIVGGAADAQERPQERTAPTMDSRACAPGDRLQPGASNPSAPTTGESLSDKLARTDGVICPPLVDPGIRMPTPDAGTTPVIPPPGSPGGDPTVRPK